MTDLFQEPEDATPLALRNIPNAQHRALLRSPPVPISWALADADQFAGALVTIDALAVRSRSPNKIVAQRPTRVECP
jgi:hypothetical protein